MASKQAKLVEVNRWQMGRPQWNYHPTLTYWHRFILTAMHDAFQVEGGKPTDEALLARDWFATSSPGIEVNGRREFVSFPECCHWLDLDVDAERVGVLAAIDAHADFDTDEAWSRLEVLSAAIPDDTEALFEVPDVFRVVPVRDQGTLLSQPELASLAIAVRKKTGPRRSMLVDLYQVAQVEQESLFGMVN
jgi:hypothetical protein